MMIFLFNRVGIDDSHHLLIDFQFFLLLVNIVRASNQCVCSLAAADGEIPIDAAAAKR